VVHPSISDPPRTDFSNDIVHPSIEAPTVPLAEAADFAQEPGAPLPVIVCPEALPAVVPEFGDAGQLLLRADPEL
jgi:hypothetical protein